MGGTNATEATQKLIALNVFPDEMVRTESGVKKVYNVYQGEVTVTFTSDGDSFNLDFQNLPKDVAIAIGTIDWGTSDASGLQEVTIGDESNS